MFVEPPDLPAFIQTQLPFERTAWKLESGPDAGRTIHFIDHGPRDGKPVLMLHGNPTWSFLWRKVIKALPRHRCIAPDLLGLGFSSHLSRISDHTPARHADAITALIEALDLRNFVLVGQDWGGPIATSTGARVPERVSAVVLGNTGVILPKRPLRSLFHRAARLPVLSDLVFRGLGFPQNILHRIQGDPSSIRGDVAKAYRWPLRGWSRRIAPLAMARMVPNGPEHFSMPELARGEEWIREFNGRIALVWGMNDPILGRLVDRHERELTPESVVRTDAGHFLQEEVPEEIAVAVERVGR
ncbi:MAG: alpha/beta fold hydrolase [Acidobacteria bacterium]|nr:alpha/beta fold hydrolase [Acidobacteriota bacterium]